MSTRIRYTEEFKREAVSQVIDRGHSVNSVAARLGISTKSLYDWKKRFGDGRNAQQTKEDNELRAVKAELKRVTEERDILKKAAAYFASQSR